MLVEDSHPAFAYDADDEERSVRVNRERLSTQGIGGLDGGNCAAAHAAGEGHGVAITAPRNARGSASRDLNGILEVRRNRLGKRHHKVTV